MRSTHQISLFNPLSALPADPLRAFFLFFRPKRSFAASRASFIILSFSNLICAGDLGTSCGLTPPPPTDAPRIRKRPSFSVSVMIGEAAGRYLCSSEYLWGPSAVRSGFGPDHGR